MDLSFEGYALGEDYVEGRDAVRCDHDKQVGGDVVDVAHFAVIHAPLTGEVEICCKQGGHDGLYVVYVVIGFIRFPDHGGPLDARRGPSCRRPPLCAGKEYMETKVIQIAPLAFMRGRTLNDAVIVLDEAQNTTTQQIELSPHRSCRCRPDRGQT